jgi:general secretion pathway protein D
VDSRPFQTFYLTNATQVNDANEITVAVRNLLPPDVKVFLVPSQNAITMRGTPDQLALAQKIISDLDRPKKTYRLTFTSGWPDRSLGHNFGPPLHRERCRRFSVLSLSTGSATPSLSRGETAGKAGISVIPPIIWTTGAGTQMPLDSYSLCRYL